MAEEIKEYGQTELFVDPNLGPVSSAGGIDCSANSDDFVGNNGYLCDIDMTSLEAEVPVPSFPCNNSQTSVPTLLSDFDAFQAHNRDVKDSLAEPGVAGLRNLGNTCFMNSGMQCLLSNPCIVKYFTEDFNTDETNRYTLTGKFASLLRKFWSGSFSLLHPSDFKDMVGLYHPQFQDYRQHDCQEFLALLLDSLHEHLNAGSSHIKCNSSGTDAEEGGTGIGVGGGTGGGGGTLSMKDCLAELESNDSSEAGSECCTGEACHLSCPPSDFAVCSIGEKSRKETMTLDCMNQLYGASEDSNLSEPSRASTDSGVSDQSRGCTVRWDPIPEEMKTETGFFGHPGPFGVVSSCIAAVTVGLNEDGCSGDEPKREVDGVEMEINGGGGVGERKLPSIEDFCMKDTKTLNTNVLATEYMQEVVSTDSKKFLKLDNNSRSSVMVRDEEVDAYEHLNDLLTCDTEKETCKPVKETNLLVNCRDKFSDKGYYGKKLLFSDLESGDEYNINNTKRMKVDEEEKNLRMQSKHKVNTEQNQTRDLDSKTSVVGGVHSFDDQTFAGPSASGDQLLSVQRTLSATAMTCLNNEDHLWVKYVRSAEKAWTKYTQQNKSVIVDTFQGQFKSTVICLECHHISVTFEPFMYLSVPLPHALERQISVTFIPCDNKKPVRCLITVTRQDNVKRLRQELIVLIGEESCDIILAEVFDNHIARILEDSMQSKFINDTDRTIYAFEMLPPPRLDDALTEQSPFGDLKPEVEDDILLPNNVLSSSAKDKMLSTHCNSPSNVSDLLDYFEGENAVRSVTTMEVDATYVAESSTENLLNNSYEMSQSVGMCDSRLETNPDVNWQHNLLQLPTTMTDSTDDNLLGTSVWKASNSMGSDIVWGEGDDSIQIGQPSAVVGSRQMETGNLQPTKFGEDGASGGYLDEPAPSCENEVDQWKSCAICLEEMVDSDLVIHASCGGTLCHPCLEMSFKHYGRTSYTCPICSATVSPSEDFVKLNSMDDYKPKTRILSVPVMYRYDQVGEKGQKVMKLFGHPNILYLPSKLTGELLYETVDRVVPCIVNYSIILTDGQGYRCSRCLYAQHCSGCELSRDGQLSLQPSDHLVVKFTDLSEAQMDLAKQAVDHISMEKLRSSAPLTLYNCFQAFTESEMLDEHNPWFCPKCHKNQCAKKTMTVWRYPDTLVVYLKRFVYHELSSTKIDSKVIFPVGNLDLSNYTSGPRTDSLNYDLQSCVCHFGGANSGHYTAYAKHPIKEEWFYFNDETTVKQEPQEADYSHAYVLFYQRKGKPVQFRLPQKLGSDDNIDSDCALNSYISPIALAPHMSPVQNDAEADFGTSDQCTNNTDGEQAKASRNCYDFYS